jgi:hypothetical protein
MVAHRPDRKWLESEAKPSMHAIPKDTGQLFVGPPEPCKAFLRDCSANYIYILRRPDGRPFYVGQGGGPRVFFHENEARHPNNWQTNDHKLNVIRSIWRSGDRVTYEIDFVSDDKVAINNREEELIRQFGRLHEGGPLTNRAPGGRSLDEASPFSKDKHTTALSGIPDNDPDRAKLNRFVLAIAPMKSAVLKPINRKFIPKPTQRNREFMAPTRRQAAALAVSAAANGVFLDGPCLLPRRVEVEGVKGFVENGVACDILVSRMADIIWAENPADEVFSLSAAQAKAVVDFIGLKKCTDLGIVESGALENQRFREIDGSR